MPLVCTEVEAQNLAAEMVIVGLGSLVRVELGKLEWVCLGSLVWVGLGNLEFEQDSLQTGLWCTQVGMAEAPVETDTGNLVEMKMF